MFLGHMVINCHVRMEPKKVLAIVEWQHPSTIPELRSFLGVANYYHACKVAFEKLKMAIASEPVLCLPDFELPFEVHTDAFDRAIGGVLMQEADALSRKEVFATFYSISRVESDMLDRIKAVTASDTTYEKLVQQVKDEIIRRYWIEDDLLIYMGERRIFVPAVGGLQKELLKETHDLQWVGHPGVDGFPKVDDMSSIMVVVDRFSTYAIFIAAPSACPLDVVAELFYRHVVKFFGLHNDIPLKSTAWLGARIDSLFLGSSIVGMCARHAKQRMDLWQHAGVAQAQVERDVDLMVANRCEERTRGIGAFSQAWLTEFHSDGVIRRIMTGGNHEIREMLSSVEVLLGVVPDGEDVCNLRMTSSIETGPQRPLVRVPEPMSFGGTRSAKELENFLWDMEQYFVAAKMPKTDKKIDMWDRLKKEMKDQFLPGNTSWIARDGLKRLKWSGSMRDYVKEFSSLMLDIQNMFEEDQLYNFLYGLQTWAQVELHRQNVKDLPCAIVAADALVDLRTSKENLNTSSSSKSNFIRKDKKGDWKKEVKKDAKKKDSGNNHGKGKTKHSTARGKDNLKNHGCFLCNDPHFAKDCPKREKLNALLLEDMMRAHSLRLHIFVMMNGKSANAMVDIGATHTFVSAKLVQDYGMSICECPRYIKSVNAKAQVVVGMTYNVPLTVGTWVGKANMMVIRKTKMVPMPHLDRVMKKEKTNIISAISLEKGLRQGESTYLATLIDAKPAQNIELLVGVQDILSKFKDVMPSELPKCLPPRRNIDHKIELIPGVVPPVTLLYRMFLLELAELQGCPIDRPIKEERAVGMVRCMQGYGGKELLKETHDPQWAGHPDVEWMLALLAHSYIWPKMENNVEVYVKTCLVCQQYKTERKKEARLLQLLPIPEKPWVSVSMAFISGFLKVDDMSSIMVVVDIFSKYAIFITAPSACPSDVATELFYCHVIKFFGLPNDIVSDRGTRFTGRFWTTLFNMMGNDLKFSIANHPHTDGQTERINHVLEKYLWHYVIASQKNWLELLDSAQFCYNLHKSSSMEMSPFEIVLGEQPTTPMEIAKQKSGGNFLKKFHADDMDPSRSYAKRAPPVVRKQFSDDVAEILIHRTFGMSKKNRRIEFLVFWKGKLKSEATWERDVTLWQFEK
ncbi:hypothetical protein ZIOFF_070450 [Zingiber officinale]|uniref:Uncharacterized protein n=1 Tax=Zingiber officinale TaxID=94328 RepID=A0A8J5EQN7_ZINOF|nr:hypothetical protein ZIOFF_070450 [Zingiber officinale]